MLDFSDKYYMGLAILEAKKALANSEIPIGAVLVGSRGILARAYNQVETLQDATAHAEILVITKASQSLNSKNLSQSRLYVSVEPCLMCFGAIIQARIRHLIFACHNPKYGYSTHTKPPNYLQIRHGILAEEARKLMQDFFQDKRK